MERRLTSKTKSSPLPIDYLEMVTEIFSSHFDTGLKLYSEIRPNSHFQAFGEIFSNEIILAVSLICEGHLSATTVYASSNFDPQASAPTAQEILSACVDAIGTIYQPLLDPSHPEMVSHLAEESLSSLENVPFDWTLIEANQKQIYVKIDKSNPTLDGLADHWLRKNDPDLEKLESENQKETEKLFVTGPSKKPTPGGGSGVIH